LTEYAILNVIDTEGATKMPFELNEYHRNISKDDLIADLQRVAHDNGLTTIPQKLYGQLGKYTHKVFYSNFGSWNNALLAAGLEISSRRRDISSNELFENIEHVWITLGRQPTYAEMNSAISRFSTKPYENRFGSWRNALVAFINYINESPSPTATIADKKAQSKTNRNINPRLRFLVMQRDYFKCCACGASPAKDPAVVLHVDHIIPWSKGGSTTAENLQTLCSKCNLGKGDLIL
jgi:hypothetical protein